MIGNDMMSPHTLLNKSFDAHRASMPTELRCQQSFDANEDRYLVTGTLGH